MKNAKMIYQIPIIFLLVTTLLLPITACAAGLREPVSHPAYIAQYVRTNGYHSDVTYPVISVIKTKDELTAYYDKNKALYALERRSGTIPSDSTIGFLDAVDAYDEAWFKNNLLVFILLQEGSGSNRHLVKDYIQDEQSTQILIERNVPPIGTADMAQWHVIVALSRKDFRDQPISVKFS